MAPSKDEDEHRVEGAHGTLAEQEDEAHYDDRSDADDDVEKGRIRFPESRLYGRERELGTLHNIYDELACSCDGNFSTRKRMGTSKRRGSLGASESRESLREDQFFETTSDPFHYFRVVFLSGCSGMGKSALVQEFARQVQDRHRSSPDDESVILCASGKCSTKVGASAPFSAISEMLERAALDLSRRDEARSRVTRKIGESDLIGSGTEGNLVLRSTFAALAPLLGAGGRTHDCYEETEPCRQDKCKWTQIEPEKGRRAGRRRSLRSPLCSSLTAAQPLADEPCKQDKSEGSRAESDARRGDSRSDSGTRRAGRRRSLRSLTESFNAQPLVDESHEEEKGRGSRAETETRRGPDGRGEPGTRRAGRRRSLRGCSRSLTTQPSLDEACEGRNMLDSANLVRADEARGRTSSDAANPVRLSMEAIKECTCEVLSILCEALGYPSVLCLEDLQWGDDASIELLSFLLSSAKLRNIMFVCAYRSNEVDADHPFMKLMRNVTRTRQGGGSTPKSVERIDLFNLSLGVVTRFIADAVKKDKDEEVVELAEAIYAKTMGNIFFVMQALEELVRKNVLFYDVMSFEWRWVVSKMELASYLSDDVLGSVKGKIEGLSVDLRHLLAVMAHIPNTLDVSMLKALMTHGRFSFEEGGIGDLLREASDEGMLLFSTGGDNYVFAHDRIRQASLEIVAEEDRDELLIHISTVLLDFAEGPEMEWCLYVAVDLLNSLPFDKSTCLDLVKLNLKVSKTAKNRGAIEKENQLLHKALRCLRASGIAWVEYDLILEIYNSVTVSEYCRGSFDRARIAIDKVIRHAKSREDKIQAYLYQILCNCDETADYREGVKDGCKILNLHGFNIPTTPTAAYMVREGMKLNMALRHRSYSCLLNLPANDDPMFKLIATVQKYARWTSNNKLAKILAWKAIRRAIDRGASGHLPIIMAAHATVLADEGSVKAALEMGRVSLDLAGRLIHRDRENSAHARMLAHGGVLNRIRPFRSSLEPLLRCHGDLKLFGGDSEAILGSMVMYFDSWLAAGLELGPPLESKLRLVEELGRSRGRLGFRATFQILRQFALNLRTSSRDPTELQGEAFREEEVLNEMDGNARIMALRDSCSSRLQLAFIFWDEDAMERMLTILRDYPLKDNSVPRLHNRLCFMGLAAFGLGERRAGESFLKLGQKCLRHFEQLTKVGSANAKPVHLFMLAMKGPNREAFNKAIDACSEASMVHLQAMVKERYAAFLNTENNGALANDYISASYWLYQDWGAHAKASQLLQMHDFLNNAKRSRGICASERPTVLKRGNVAFRKSIRASFNSDRILTGVNARSYCRDI